MARRRKFERGAPCQRLFATPSAVESGPDDPRGRVAVGPPVRACAREPLGAILVARGMRELPMNRPPSAVS
jgi:hypothetical protein